MTKEQAPAGNEKFITSLGKMSLPEIARNIDSIEEMAWYLNHDATDGRVDSKSAQSDILNLRNLRDRVVAVFAQKANLDPNNFSALRTKINEELEKYNMEMKEKWTKIAKVGAVFIIKSEDEFQEGRSVETIAVYDSEYTPKQSVVFYRERGAGIYGHIDERDVEYLELTEKIRPILINDNPEFIRRTRNGELCGIASFIIHPGRVFKFEGDEWDPRNGTYETFYHFKRPNSNNDVVIARNHDKPMIAEFTGADTSYITMLEDGQRKFIKKENRATIIPKLDIYS